MKQSAGMAAPRGAGTWRVRAAFALGAIVLAALVAWWVIPPRATPAPSGTSYDRRDNAMWLSRHWLHEPVSDDELDVLVARLASHGIATVYPFLGPMDERGWPGWRDRGVIRRFRHQQARDFRQRLRDRAPNVRVVPWTGGIYREDVVLADRARIAGFLEQARWLTTDGGFDGIHLNVEPLHDDDPEFLAFLAELREELPAGRLLSVAAYPPTTLLHPYKRVHWSRGYLDRVCRVADDLAVMTYDTALRWPTIYVRLMALWTRELATLPAVRASECELRLGVPTYEDVAPWHDPRTETVTTALVGIRSGLARLASAPTAVRGIAIYADWTTDADEWARIDGEWIAGGARGG
ncbi:MAG: glycosyl hydrolase family 18 protein [bacterium]